MAPCLIGLGSNLGDRRRHLLEALAHLRIESCITSVVCSDFFETSPVGGASPQPGFLNAVALLETTLPPLELLALTQRIESELGRRRDVRWGPRSIDLDLLLYDDLVFDSPTLTIPHPRMAWRRFVLEPASQIAPDMIHPTTGWTMRRLFDHLRTAPSYIALSGPIAAGKTTLLNHLENAAQVVVLKEEPPEAHLLVDFYSDPTKNGWATENAFLQQRRQCLDKENFAKNIKNQYAVSDFWFDQSLAFARVWLTASDFSRFEEKWLAAREKVVRPKLTVFLDVPTEVLVERIRSRNRAGEDRLDKTRLQQIHDSLLGQLASSDVGPVMRLSYDQRDHALAELLAALDAMR